MGDIGDNGLAGVVLPAETLLTMRFEVDELKLPVDWEVVMEESAFRLLLREKRPISRGLNRAIGRDEKGFCRS